MRKVLAVVLAIMSLSATAWTAPAKHKPTMKVGMLVPTLQSEFYVYCGEGLKTGLKAKGYDVTVTGYDSNSSKAIEVIENFTIANVDAIVAMVTDRSCDEALKAAMDKGIKVIVPGVETGAYDVCLLADNKDVGTKIGEMASSFVNANLGGEAEAVAFVSTQNSDMADRSNAMLATFKKFSPKAKIVGQTEYKNVGDASAAMENFLQQHPKVKIVISYSDLCALEAVEVMKAAGKAGADCAAFGCDSTEQGLKSIASGGIFRGPVSMGNIVDDIVSSTYRMLQNDPTLPKRKINVNVKVTVDNVAQYLKK